MISNMSSDPSLSLEENLGPRLLWCLENVFPLMSFTPENFSSFHDNLALQYTVTSCDSLRDNRVIEINATDTTISLSGNYTSDCDISIFSMTYKLQNDTFSSQYDNGEETGYSYYLASDLRTNIVMLNNKSHHVVNVNMSFTCGTIDCDRTAVCVFWDFTLKKWSSKGCQTQVTNGMTQCICDHLTSFAVLMSGSIPDDGPNGTILSLITSVGLALSIASLLLCISIQGLLLKRCRVDVAMYRHVSILHISAFLFIFNVSFLATDLIKKDTHETLCVALTFCSHLSLLGFFCWTLVQGIYLVGRLVFVFHHVTKTEFLVLSIVLGYVCPLAIALGTFLVYFPHHYKMDKTCWLDRRSGAFMAFNVPIIIIMVLNFFILIVVIRKLLRPSISEGKREDEEVVKKLAKAVLICVPQFGLTWAIGIPLFAGSNDLSLQYLFCLLNPLQGFFILLFACLLDNKVMDLVKKYFMKSSPNNSMEATIIS